MKQKINCSVCNKSCKIEFICKKIVRWLVILTKKLQVIFLLYMRIYLCFFMNWCKNTNCEITSCETNQVYFWFIFQNGKLWRVSQKIMCLLLEVCVCVYMAKSLFLIWIFFLIWVWCPFYSVCATISPSKSSGSSIRKL